MHNTDYSVGHYLFPSGVDAQKNEKEDGETPQRRTAIAEEWQGYAYDRA